MTKRSIQEIDKEINELSQQISDLYKMSLYRDDHYGFRWRDSSVIPEINRLGRRIERLYCKRNQARFRDWGNYINGNCKS